MTTKCKNKSIDKNVKKVLSRTDDLCVVEFSSLLSEMKLSKDYRSIAKEISDCGGYSGHCGCLNNACMMCTAFH
jgi:hypothetical protein